MTGTGDVRECARGAHCSGARDGQGVYGPRAFCDQDAALIRRALDDTPTLYAELRELLGDKTSGAESGRRAPSTDPGMPINAGVEAALAALSGTILAWEERLRPVLGLPPAPAPSWSREPARVAEACRLMSHRLTALLSLPLDAMVVAGGGTDHRGGRGRRPGHPGGVPGGGPVGAPAPGRGGGAGPVPPGVRRPVAAAQGRERACPVPALRGVRPCR